MRKVVAFGLVGGAQREGAVALGRGGVIDFAGDAPDIRPFGRAHRHAPPECLANLTIVELHGRAKGRAAVVGGKRLHRRERPLLGCEALGVPAAVSRALTRNGRRKPVRYSK